MRASIEWVPAEQGGRKVRPTGEGPRGYLPTVHLKGEPWPGKVVWTLVVIKQFDDAAGTDWIADVRFLVDEAPQHLLSEGKTFDLYEGPKLVARGKILGTRSVISGMEAKVGSA